MSDNPNIDAARQVLHVAGHVLAKEIREWIATGQSNTPLVVVDTLDLLTDRVFEANDNDATDAFRKGLKAFIEDDPMFAEYFAEADTLSAIVLGVATTVETIANGLWEQAPVV